MSEGRAAVQRWFEDQGWTPFDFQTRTWDAFLAGQSGLVHVPTGAGKTYAAFGGPLADLIDTRPRGLHTLYITPLRAVARDITAALARPVADLGVKIRVESRTGDTSSSIRTKQRKALPGVLVTTPESLSIQLTYADARKRFASVRCIVLDEWHSLLGTKRGALLELALSRVRSMAPQVRTWALSATLRDPQSAADAATGGDAQLISAPIDREIHVRSIRPNSADDMPWFGRMGFTMLPQVLDALDPDRSTLLFTTTRNQAENWYFALSKARPDWVPKMGLHHSAIDGDERRRVELGLDDGSVTLVVCTASLDLGVDFGPVERVFNIGSPKGIARLIQRAGRSGHSPGKPCTIICVPTHALELVEIAAAREAIHAGLVEETPALDAPLDVLVQHMVGCAVGGGFTADGLFAEVRTAASFKGVRREEFDWALALVEHGGDTLKAYPDYHKVALDAHGTYHIASTKLARMHRLSVGTITEYASVAVQMRGKGNLGRVEENFIAGLRPGDTFGFAGQVVEFVELKETRAIVKKARRKAGKIPAWGGGRLPISTALADAVLDQIARHAAQTADAPEMQVAAPILAAQAKGSALPDDGPILVEICDTDEGSHLFVYPFAGRNAHEGVASLLAFRLGQIEPASFSIAMNEYGFELVCDGPYPYRTLLQDPGIFAIDTLIDDVRAAVNLSELSRRQFRDVARIAGLVFAGWPGRSKTLRQIQTSTSLLFDVFTRFDPDNLLLHQVRREVLARSFEFTRLTAVLNRVQHRGLRIFDVERPTPFGYPLVFDRLGTALSTESVRQRIERAQAHWSGTADRVN
jgi:ATP-dependent Lhr-like helicase